MTADELRAPGTDDDPQSYTTSPVTTRLWITAGLLVLGVLVAYALSKGVR